MAMSMSISTALPPKTRCRPSLLFSSLDSAPALAFAVHFSSSGSACWLHDIWNTTPPFYILLSVSYYAHILATCTTHVLLLPWSSFSLRSTTAQLCGQKNCPSLYGCLVPQVLLVGERLNRHVLSWRRLTRKVQLID